MSKLQKWWEDIRSSLWFLPAVLTLVAVGLAAVGIQVDRRVIEEVRPEYWWLFGGGAESARDVLSTIASSIITITGVLFSITIVAIQLASSQFTPRVLRNFTADRGNQTVLGVFIGTFTYALLVLRAVRTENEDAEAFVPSLAVTVAVLLALVSMGFLIYFINHAARSMQVTLIVDRVTRETLELIDRIFPQPVGEPAEDGLQPIVLESTPAAPVLARESGYLQAVDEGALSTLAERSDLVVRMVPRIGDFLVPGQVLAWCWPLAGLDEAGQDAVRKVFVLGPERTPYQDVEFGIVELMDIAVRALSPSVNDPTTAMTCIDRLSEILARMGTREAPSRFRLSPEGRVRFIAHRTTFERVVEIAFNQIRHYGASDPAVTVRMLRTLKEVAELVPEARRAPLMTQAQAILRAAEAEIDDDMDLAGIRRAARDVLALEPDPERVWERPA